MRLILGDGQAIFLDALSTVLTQQGHEVCVTRHPDELIAQVRDQPSDACLIDSQLSDDNGIETIGRILQVSATTTVVVLGACAEAEQAEEVLDAGAAGYLHQSRGVDALVGALKRIRDGERVIDIPDAPSRRQHSQSRAALLADGLTARERECLSLLVAGLDTAAMVQRLGVSRTTVRTHLQAVLTKLCVHSRLEAASFAVRHRLVEAWASPDSGSPAAPATSAAAALAASGAPIHAVGEPAAPDWQTSPDLVASG
jgi:two-component system, NarL family, nitrate/nitrite response regulator NarL